MPAVARTTVAEHTFGLILALPTSRSSFWKNWKFPTDRSIECRGSRMTPAPLPPRIAVRHVFFAGRSAVLSMLPGIAPRGERHQALLCVVLTRNQLHTKSPDAKKSTRHTQNPASNNIAILLCNRLLINIQITPGLA